MSQYSAGERMRIFIGDGMVAEDVRRRLNNIRDCEPPFENEEDGIGRIRRVLVFLGNRSRDSAERRRDVLVTVAAITMKAIEFLDHQKEKG